MSRIFSPKIPKAPEPVKPPTIDDTRQAEEELMRLRRRRGRLSTFIAARDMPRKTSAASALLDGGSPVGGSGGPGGEGRALVPRVLASKALL